MKGLLIFVAGVVIGGAAGAYGGYIYKTKQYDKQFQVDLQKEIDILRGRYRGNSEEVTEEDLDDGSMTYENDDNDDEVSSNIERDSVDRGHFKRQMGDYTRYHDIVEDENYGDLSEESYAVNQRRFMKEESQYPAPYIYDPDEEKEVPPEFMDFNHVVVYFDPSDYENGCTTELGEEMTDVDDKIGFDNLKILHEMIDDCPDLRNCPPVLYVRNERLSMEYEITFDGLM